MALTIQVKVRPTGKGPAARYCSRGLRSQRAYAANVKLRLIQLKREIVYWINHMGFFIYGDETPLNTNSRQYRKSSSTNVLVELKVEKVSQMNIQECPRFSFA